MSKMAATASVLWDGTIQAVMNSSSRPVTGDG
jgi:hypothetical protein